MAALRTGDDETTVVELTDPLKVLNFHVLEGVIVTGVAWILIGFAGRPEIALGVGLQNIILVIWMILLAWRIGLPLWRSRRRRFIVTDHRIIIRGRGVSTKAAAIPLSDVQDARRIRRGQLQLAMYPYGSPLVFHDIVRTKKVASTIRSILPR